MRQCIYCKNPPQFIHSKSHFIPECLGSKRTLKNLVCETCNREIGKFEQKVGKELNFYRWYLGIKSRGISPSIEADYYLSGEIKRAKVQNGLKLKHGYTPPVIKQKNSSRYFILYGDSPEALAKQWKKEFEKKYGNLFNVNKAEPIKIKRIEIPFPKPRIDSNDFLRLAAKIAFEKFAQKRYTQAISNEYDQIRNYIKTGSSNSHKPSFLIFEDKLVKNILGSIDFPCHLVLTYGYKGIIGSIVIIFGLFYYFVKLNKNAIVIHEWDDTFIYDPIQKKKLFQLYVAPSIPNLIAAVNKSLSDPDVLNKASKFGREKFNLSLQAVKK